MPASRWRLPPAGVASSSCVFCPLPAPWCGSSPLRRQRVVVVRLPPAREAPSLCFPSNRCFCSWSIFWRDTVCLSCSLSPFRFWRAWFAGCGAPSCFLWDVVFFIVVRHAGVGCPKGCPWGGDEVPLGIRLRRACVRLPEGASAGVRRCPQGCLWTGWGCSGDPMTHPDVPFYPCTTCRLQPRLVRAAADAMRDTPHGGSVAGSN